MAYSFQTFTVGQVLTAAQMNQVEANIRDHIHGVAGVLGGNNVVKISTDVVSLGNTTNSFCVVSFSIPADSIGSSSTIRVTANCRLALVDDSGQVDFFGGVGGTVVCSGRVQLLSSTNSMSIALNGGLSLQFLVSGGGATNSQICNLGFSQLSFVTTGDLLSNNIAPAYSKVYTDISTTNKDATTALNCSIGAKFAAAAAGNSIKIFGYTVERIYL